MKKLVSFILICVLVLGLAGCRGEAKDVTVDPSESKIYTQAEIDDAMDVAIRYFKKYFSGCTLTEIAYIGDDKLDGYIEFAERHDADDVIVFISSFDVDASGGDGSLNPNSTYTGWNWILVRNDGGNWKHVDHGY